MTRRIIELVLLSVLPISLASCATDGNPQSESSKESSSPTESAPKGLKTALTLDNSSDFVALLQVKDRADSRVEKFATKYKGRTIQFDGVTSRVAGSDPYDMYIFAGDDPREDHAKGPQFVYFSASISDLNFPSSEAPTFVAPMEFYRLSARVEGYDPDEHLLLLSPVSTEVTDD